MERLSANYDIKRNKETVYDACDRIDQLGKDLLVRNLKTTPKKKHWVKQSLYLAVQCIAILVVIAALVVVLGGGA